jgi:hypothetical protein
MIGVLPFIKKISKNYDLKLTNINPDRLGETKEKHLK